MNARNMAHALLVMASVSWVLSHLVPVSWGAAWQTASEAAMVGALADWFAVTALFSRPLGFPWHTAIIPQGKERIADGLGRFIQESILDPHVIKRLLQDRDLVGDFAEWIADRENAGLLAGKVADALPGVIDGVNRRQVIEFVRATIVEQAQDVNPSGFISEILQRVKSSGKQQDLVTSAVHVAKTLIQANQSAIEARITAGGKADGWWSRALFAMFGGKVATGVVGSILKTLGEIENDASHQVRYRIDGFISSTIVRLQEDAGLRQSIYATWRELISDEQVSNAAVDIWQILADWVYDDTRKGHEQSAIAAMTADTLVFWGNKIANDRPFRIVVNFYIVETITDMASSHGKQAADLIANIVRSWDFNLLAKKIESEVGNDLQYIRINGTVVGAMIGLLLYFVGGWLHFAKLG